MACPLALCDEFFKTILEHEPHPPYVETSLGVVLEIMSLDCLLRATFKFTQCKAVGGCRAVGCFDLSGVEEFLETNWLSLQMPTTPI